MSPEVERFADVAGRYCELVESAHSLRLKARILAFATILAELYQAALKLPEVDPTTDTSLANDVTPLRDWPGFESYEGYSEVFDPYEPEEPVHTILSDDLIDIFRDLKSGLSLCRTGNLDNMADAVWEWRFNFVIHWGDHVVDALRALHRAAYRVQEDAT